MQNDVLNDTPQSENLKEVSVDQHSSAEVHMWCHPQNGVNFPNSKKWNLTADGKRGSWHSVSDAKTGFMNPAGRCVPSAMCQEQRALCVHSVCPIAYIWLRLDYYPARACAAGVM